MTEVYLHLPHNFIFNIYKTKINWIKHECNDRQTGIIYHLFNLAINQSPLQKANNYQTIKLSHLTPTANLPDGRLSARAYKNTNKKLKRLRQPQKSNKINGVLCGPFVSRHLCARRSPLPFTGKFVSTSAQAEEMEKVHNLKHNTSSAGQANWIELVAMLCAAVKAKWPVNRAQDSMSVSIIYLLQIKAKGTDRQADRRACCCCIAKGRVRPSQVSA